MALLIMVQKGLIPRWLKIASNRNRNWNGIGKCKTCSFQSMCCQLHLFMPFGILVERERERTFFVASWNKNWKKHWKCCLLFQKYLPWIEITNTLRYIIRGDWSLLSSSGKGIVLQPSGCGFESLCQILCLMFSLEKRTQWGTPTESVKT